MSKRDTLPFLWVTFQKQKNILSNFDQHLHKSLWMGSKSTYSAAEAIAKFSSFLFLLQSVMTLNFKPLGVSDEESGQIGFLVCIVCSIGGKSLLTTLLHVLKIGTLHNPIFSVVNFDWILAQYEKENVTFQKLKSLANRKLIDAEIQDISTRILELT